MVDVMVSFKDASKYLAILKIEILFGSMMDERLIISFVLDFIKANKLDLVPWDEKTYPQINTSYPSGVAIFARFKTKTEALNFTKSFKMP